MTALDELVTARLAAAAAEPYFGLSLTTASLKWLCSAEPGDASPEVLDELTRLEYVLDGELTPAGEFARNATTREGRELLMVRAQRGGVIRTLELFFDDDLVFAIDDSNAHEGAHGIGYVSAGDIVNAIARWIGILPLDARPDADTTSTLGALLERATSAEGDITLYSVATEDGLLFDVAQAGTEHYFHVEADASESEADAGNIPIRLTSISGYNLYLMLVDALLTAPADEPTA